MYSHINIWRMNPAGARHNDTAARHIAARLSKQPGFIAYTLVRTGEREVTAVTVFESRDAWDERPTIDDRRTTKDGRPRTGGFGASQPQVRSARFVFLNCLGI